VAEAEPRQQGLLVLACLRKGETFASLAAGFGVGTATAWRYVAETVAPSSHKGLIAATRREPVPYPVPGIRWTH